jgi:hypothetical protein
MIRDLVAPSASALSYFSEALINCPKLTHGSSEAFWDMLIERDGKAAAGRSAERYLRAIGRCTPKPTASRYLKELE